MRETERQLMARLKREAEEAEAAAAAASGGAPSQPASAGTGEEVAKKSESEKKKVAPSSTGKKKAPPAKRGAVSGDKGKKGKSGGGGGSAKKGSAASGESQTPNTKKGGKSSTNKKKASPPKKTKALSSPSSAVGGKKGKTASNSKPEAKTNNELVGSDDNSDDDESDGSYELSTCCECGQLEDRSVDIPILLCDGCDNECHLTCARDRPKMTKVPEGDWYCSACVKKRKKAVSGGGGKKKKKNQKLTLEERKRLDAEKAAAKQESGSTLSTEELAGLVASSEKKEDDGGAKKRTKKVDMDDFDMDSSSSYDSDSPEEDEKPWVKKERESVPVKKEATSEPAVARKRTLEEVKQEMIEKKKKNQAGGSAGDAVKAETKPKISLISGMAPPPASAVAPPSAVAATAVPLGRAAAGAVGRSQSFGQQQQQQQQQKSWNVPFVKREPVPSSTAQTPHQPPRGSPRRSPVPAPSGPPASPHPPILNSPEKRAQSRSLLGKLDGVIDTVTGAPIGGKETAPLAWTGSDQDRMRARNNGMDFVSIKANAYLSVVDATLFSPTQSQSHMYSFLFFGWPQHRTAHSARLPVTVTTSSTRTTLVGPSPPRPRFQCSRKTSSPGSTGIVRPGRFRRNGPCRGGASSSRARICSMSTGGAILSCEGC